MFDKEIEAMLLPLVYFLILALPWIYSINPKLFDALAIIALVFLGLMTAVIIFFFVFTYFFHNLLNG